MEFVRKTVRWIRALGPWLMQAQPVWGPIGIVVLALLATIGTSLVLGNLDALLRYCGLFFQLLGIGTVVFGITSKRRLFDRPKLREHLRNWLNRRPRWGVTQQTILVAEAASLGFSEGRAELSTWHRAEPGASLEDRMTAAEANLVTLRTELGEVAEEARAEARQRAEAVDAERRARENTARNLRTQLEGLGAEGLNVERTGVFWLVVGVVLATIPGEVACAVNWVAGW